MAELIQKFFLAIKFSFMHIAHSLNFIQIGRRVTALIAINKSKMASERQNLYEIAFHVYIDIC